MFLLGSSAMIGCLHLPERVQGLGPLLRVLLLLLFVFDFGCARSAAENGNPERLAPLSIRGVAPGAKLSSVLTMLGDPLERQLNDGSIVLSLVYPGMEVGFDEDRRVAFIESTAKDSCLLRAVCVGASATSMRGELSKDGYIFDLEGDALIIQGDSCCKTAFLSPVPAEIAFGTPTGSSLGAEH